MSMESVDVVSTLLSMVRYVLVCISALTVISTPSQALLMGALRFYRYF
jgi:hypothetical protein